MPQALKIVIINGYNLQSHDWQEVVYGVKDRPGRGPFGIHVALQEHANIVLWNSGASQKSWHGEALYEGQWTHRFMHMCAKSMVADYPYHFRGYSATALHAYLSDGATHRFEHESTNTLTSAIKAFYFIDELVGRRAAHIISVSSRNHTRAGHHFQMVLQQGFKGIGPLRSPLVRVSHECAYTGYGSDGTMERVAINEHSDRDQYELP